MNKKELLKEIKNRTEIGKAYARMQLNFIKWMSKRALNNYNRQVEL